MATTRGPKPFDQHAVSTRFLRVPAMDWPAVKRGLKTEFRKVGKGAGGYGLDKMEFPTPVVIYMSSPKTHLGHELGYQVESKLAVLEQVEREPLGAISEDSLKREGFPDLKTFRRYWIQRERRRWTPTRLVWVYRVRPWTEDDRHYFALRLFDHLYGGFDG